MRLSEIASPVKLFATKRYLKNAAAYAQGGYPNFASGLRAFLEAKVRSPLTPVGKKDEPFTGGNFQGKGIWHAHIIHGKVMVVYIPTATSIQLYDVIEHTAVDTPAAGRALYNFIASAKLEALAPKAATPAQETRNKTGLTPGEQSELNDLLKFMARDDREIVEQAIRGDFTGLRAFIELVPLEWEAVVYHMGGTNKLRQHLRKLL